MDIIGSKAQGEKITAQVGGNLKIETLQEKETYEEDNHSTGFGVSWSVNQTKKETTDANGDTKIETLRSFSKPTFSGSWNKGNIDSHYRSARDQAGFFAGSKGFDIYVEKNTDLKGGVIASEASADKNRLSTGTLSFSDLHNEAEYSAKDTGGSAQIKPTLVQIKKEDPEGNKIESLKVVQALHSTPSIPTVVQGSADSTTKTAVAPGIIDIRENKAQDISALSRDTANSLNELGKIFDKAKIEEQQELAAVFGEEAFRLAHNLKDDGSGRKIAIHIAIGGIMSQITGAGFASGAIGAGLNEALINNLKGLDPGTAQIVSNIIGAAAAKVAGGNALVGASAAASGTKWNHLGENHPDSYPVQVGIAIESGVIGHASLVVLYSDGHYEEANYGRYGDNVGRLFPSLSGYGPANYTGGGVYVIDNDFNPYNAMKPIYMLNPAYVNANDVVFSYNYVIDHYFGGYSRINKEITLSNERTISYHYQAPTGVNDYHIWNNSCVTTTNDAIRFGLQNLTAIARERWSLLAESHEPNTTGNKLAADYELLNGRGLVSEVIR